MQSDDEIEMMDEQIQEEMNDPRYGVIDAGDQPGQPGQDQGAAGGGQPTQQQSSDDQSLQSALATYQLLKPKKNKNMQELSQFKAAAEILAKSGQMSQMFN